jgi:hypothetical protein
MPGKRSSSLGWRQGVWVWKGESIGVVGGWVDEGDREEVDMASYLDEVDYPPVILGRGRVTPCGAKSKK